VRPREVAAVGAASGPVTGRLVARAYCGEPPATELDRFDGDRFAG